MPEIVLATLNAKYIHASFGLRYLLANLGPLRPSACLAEFDINQRPVDIAEVLLAREPKIVGFGVYIWNAAETAEVVATLGSPGAATRAAQAIWRLTSSSGNHREACPGSR